MGKESKQLNYTKICCVRFTQPEYQKLMAAFRQTTCRKLSEYIRDVLLGNPVTVYTRDKNADDIVAALLTLKTELTAIGRNFNQAVRKLNRMDSDPEIKIWAFLNEKSKKNILQKMDEINELIEKISAKW